MIVALRIVNYCVLQRRDLSRKSLEVNEMSSALGLCAVVQ